MTPTHTASTQADLGALAARLESAAEEFSDHSCNDFTLVANPDNQAIVLAALKFIEAGGDYEEDWDDFAADVRAAEDEIAFFDNWLMAYMAHRCRELASGRAGAPLSEAEGAVIAELLGLVDELNEQ